MEDTFQYNDKAWPIVEVIFPKHELSLEEISMYLQKLETYFDRNELMFLILDISESGWVSPQQRFEIGKWIMSDKERIRKLMKGTAYVAKNQIIRLALQTFMSFEDVNKVIGPIKVFSSIELARKWASETFIST